MSIRKLKSGRYKAEPMINGLRLPSKTFDTKKEASKYHAQMLANHKGERVYSKVSFMDVVERYENTYLPKLKSGTVKRNRVDLTQRIIPRFQHHTISKITSTEIERFQTDLVNSTLSNKSVNNCMNVLNSILNQAVKWKYIDANPSDIKPLKVAKIVDNNWWDNETHIEYFIEQLKGDHYEAAILTSLELGLRQAEVTGLCKGDINFTTGLIHVHRQWDDDTKDYQPLKNYDTRNIKFNPDSYFGRLLRIAVNSSPLVDAVFYTSEGNKLRNDRLYKAFARVRNRCFVRKINFHGLRHTFASWFMIRGGNIWDLKQILGHANIATTMKYAHHSPTTSVVDLGFSKPKENETTTVVRLGSHS